MAAAAEKWMRRGGGGSAIYARGLGLLGAPSILDVRARAETRGAHRGAGQVRRVGSRACVRCAGRASDGGAGSQGACALGLEGRAALPW